MLSDERLAKIEGLVCANLNEDGAPAKVGSRPSSFYQFVAHSLSHYCKGGIAAVNSRVYAVKVNLPTLLAYFLLNFIAILRQIVIAFLTLLAKLTKKMSGTSMHSIVRFPRRTISQLR